MSFIYIVNIKEENNKELTSEKRSILLQVSKQAPND